MLISVKKSFQMEPFAIMVMEMQGIMALLAEADVALTQVAATNYLMGGFKNGNYSKCFTDG